MRVRVLLQIAPDDGDFGAVAEVATFEKHTGRVEDIGPSLAEGKTLLTAVQRLAVERQASTRIEGHRCCASCGRRRRSRAR